MFNNTVVVKCPICGRPFVVVPGVKTSNACINCTRKAEENSHPREWEHR